MKFTRRYPSNRALIDVVKSYWKLEIEAEDIPISQLYFPYGSFELVYYLKGRGVMQYVGNTHRFKQPKMSYSGQFTKPFFLHFNGACICYGVSLKPWAGNVLFDIPSDQFTDEMVELGDLGLKNLLLDELVKDEDVFLELENCLLKKMNFKSLDKSSAHLAQMLLNSPDRQTANEQIAKIGLSRRRVEQKFLSATGLNIGSYSRKIRFQKSIHLLSLYQPVNSLTSLGLEAGYYDQSHFISEFKTFTSVTPLVYLKQRSDLQNFLAALTATE